jgi:hypothetical protein
MPKKSVPIENNYNSLNIAGLFYIDLAERKGNPLPALIGSV